MGNTQKVTPSCATCVTNSNTYVKAHEVEPCMITSCCRDSREWPFRYYVSKDTRDARIATLEKEREHILTVLDTIKAKTRERRPYTSKSEREAFEFVEDTVAKLIWEMGGCE